MSRAVWWNPDGTTGEVRVCYVVAWKDPQWRQQNGLPPLKPKRAGKRSGVA